MSEGSRDVRASQRSDSGADHDHSAFTGPGRWAALVAVVVSAVLVVVSVLDLAPPAPRPADAPATEFSAGRAFAHVERIGARTHVAGSAAGDDVRGYLVATLDGFGVRTEVQDTVGLTGGPQLARVRNVVGLLPGTASTGRVFLVAHHDSVQVGPGAADDGSGVSAILETVRALSSGPRLRNDVVVVLTDAEEACLCGAEAFVSQHPLAADGGVVLNLEARGSAGPPVTFQTSPGNAGLAEVFGRAAPHPVASSVAVEVYRALPNDTDFTEFLAAGRFTGLDTAHIDGWATYHTPQDTPDRLDRGSLQAHGDNALAMARDLGGTDLGPLARPATADATYFPVPGGLVRYPAALVWPLAVLGLVAVGAFGWAALRRRATSGRRLLAGAGLALVPLIVAPVAVTAAWTGLVALRPGYAEMLDPWQPGPFRFAVLALVATVVLGWFVGSRRWVGAPAVTFGVLVWVAMLAAVLAAFAPGGSYLGALPALAGGAAGTAALLLRGPVVRVVAVAVGAGVAVVVLTPTVVLFFPALGLAGAAAPALLATLLGLLLLPTLPIRPGWPALGAVALTAVLAATGLVVDRFDAQRPLPAQLMYALDADTGRARWLSTEADPGEWTSRFVTGRADASDISPVLGAELATGPAQATDLPAPALTIESDVVSGAGRTVTVRVVPGRPARLLGLRVDGATVTRATIAGRDVDPGRIVEGPFGAVFHAPPLEGVTATFVLTGADVRLWVGDGSDGLTGLPGFVPRPPGVGIMGSHYSELVLVSRTYPLG